jgi:hypothetical protein
MTGIVLALAGLTCGDGGPTSGAATATVVTETAVFLRGEWEGIRSFDGNRLGRFRLRDGKVTGPSPYLVIRPDGPGQVRIETFPISRTAAGIWKRDGREVIICAAFSPAPRPRSYSPGGENFLIVLRPAAPRKP